MSKITLFAHTIVTEDLEPIAFAGVGNTLRYLLPALESKGFDVNIVSLTFGNRTHLGEKYGHYGNLGKEQKEGNVTVYRVKLPVYDRLVFSLYSGAFSFRNRSVVRDCDVIHSMDSRDAPFICRPKNQKTGKAPLITSVNDYIPANTPLNPMGFRDGSDSARRYFYNNLTKAVEWFALKRSDIIVPNSGFTNKVISEAYGLDPEKVRMIYKGIGLKEFSPKKAKAVMEDKILFVGGNLEKKGAEEAILSSSQAMRDHKSYRLIMIGRGTDSYMSRLKGIAEREGIADRTEFVYHMSHDDLVRQYLSSRIFLLPSYRDSLPQAVMEAMASRLPVVASSVGGIPEAVIDGKTGFLSGAQEVEKLSAHLKALVENPKLAKRMGNAGRERCEKMFDAKRMVADYVKLYESAVNSR